MPSNSEEMYPLTSPVAMCVDVCASNGSSIFVNVAVYLTYNLLKEWQENGSLFNTLCVTSVIFDKSLCSNKASVHQHIDFIAFCCLMRAS